MNKKTLFLFFLAVILVLPNMAMGQAGGSTVGMVTLVKNAVVNIGVPVIIIGWVIAGILYLTSAGSPEKTGIAKKALIAAVIGTVLVILATFAEGIIRNLLWTGA